MIFLSFFTFASVIYFLHLNSLYNLLGSFYMQCFVFHILFSLTLITFCTSSFIPVDLEPLWTYLLVCDIPNLWVDINLSSNIFHFSYPAFEEFHYLIPLVAPTSYHTSVKNAPFWSVAFFIIQYLDPKQDHLYCWRHCFIVCCL